MGIVSNLRGPRTHQGLPLSNVLSSPASVSNKKKWSIFMPLLLTILVIVEIAFLGRLGIVKNAQFFDSLPRMFLASHSNVRNSIQWSCEEWLEVQDTVVYSRNFSKDPIWIDTNGLEMKACDVSCKIERDSGFKADAAFMLPKGSQQVLGVQRSMESSVYYLDNNIAQARRKGYSVVMTTSLSSDVPVGYFSWAEYDIMAPVMPKSEKALAAAFISNCEARNFRLKALVGLQKEDVKIDSYGYCHRNLHRTVDKVEALKHYKFSLAFENSNEEDYVTEKFFQSLVAGSIPVVVGAPNIQDFAPSPGSVLHIKGLKDVKSVAKRMKYLAEHPDAYNQSLRWKYEGPSDSFKALVDMAAVHSSCRLCIHIATVFLEKEEQSSDFKRRPCKCNNGSDTVYHLYVRERGRFKMDSIFLRSGSMTLKGLEAAVLKHYKSRNHEPVWKPERPESIRGDGLRIYRIYPLGLTQRQALYTFKFKGDDDLRNHIQNNPCAKFEVIFV